MSSLTLVISPVGYQISSLTIVEFQSLSLAISPSTLNAYHLVLTIPIQGNTLHKNIAKVPPLNKKKHFRSLILSSCYTCEQ